MSDFLSDLAARTLRAAPMVEPVTRSLFEPVSEAQDGADAWGEEHIITEVPASPPVGLRSAERAPARPPAATAETAPVYTKLAPPAARFEPIENEISRPPAPASPPAPILREHARPIVEIRSQSESAQPPASAPPAHPLSESARIESVEQIVHSATEHRLEQIRRETREITHEVRSEIYQQSEPEPAAEARTQPVIARPETRLAPVPRQPDPLRQPEVEPQAPTVRVSIGRVEVRANFAAPAPPPRPKTERPPVMPLEEYLKRGSRPR